VKANALASDSYSRSLGSLYGVKGASKASLGLGNKTKTSERGSLASRVRAVKPEVGDRIIASGEQSRVEYQLTSLLYSGQTHIEEEESENETEFLSISLLDESIQFLICCH
jgi:hypothetical protein